MRLDGKFPLRFLQFRSIKARFLVIGFGLFMLVFLLVGYIALRIESRNIQKSSNAGVEAFARLATKPIAESYDLYFDSGYYKFAEVFGNIIKLNPNIKNVQIVSVDGDVIFDSYFVTPTKYLKAEGQRVTNTSLTKADPTFIYDGSNPELKEVIYPYFTDWQSHPYSIRYLADYSQSKNDIKTLIYESVLLVLALTIGSVWVLSFATNKSLINPLKDVISTAKFISKGNYGKRAANRSRDEIGDLADSVNQMAKTLEQDIIDLKELDKLKDEFIDIAAYNLKVPINHINFDIKYLVNNLGKKIENKYVELLRDVQTNSNRLQILSEDLIGVTSMKKGSAQKNIFMPVNLSDVIKEITLETKSLLEHKKIELKLDVPKSARVLGDYSKIKQLFASLLDNAVKFTVKQNTEISIKISEKGSTYVTEIADHGVGIAKNEMPSLFRKFYRAPSSALYDREGAGLGLYLAKLIVEVHHGNIWAESEAKKGTQLFVSFFKEDVFKKKFT